MYVYMRLLFFIFHILYVHTPVSRVIIVNKLTYIIQVVYSVTYRHTLPQAHYNNMYSLALVVFVRVVSRRFLGKVPVYMLGKYVMNLSYVALDMLLPGTHKTNSACSI